MNIEDDPKFQQLIYDRQIKKERTYKNYLYVFQQVYEQIGLTPSEMLEIARDDQEPYILQKGDKLKAKLTPMDERHIYKWQREMVNYWQSLDYQNTTIVNKLVNFRTFFSDYEVQLPKNPKIHIPDKILKDGEYLLFVLLF